MNYSGALSLINLWYDWPNGRNFNIIQNQLGGPPIYDLEWNNGTSFIYTLPLLPLRTPPRRYSPPQLAQQCHLPRSRFHRRLPLQCLGEGRLHQLLRGHRNPPSVHWVFYTGEIKLLPLLFDAGRSAHVMTFEVGAAMEDEKWQAPVYCFEEGMAEKLQEAAAFGPGALKLWRVFY